ncbi:MAG: phosphoenolpyruvate carboxykinase domain-containing protein, partial [Gammaproteobacteria bacterium]
NPEAGFFGVAPGTGAKTNPNALAMLDHDAIFTNVAVTDDMQPWWEGKDKQVPAFDWQGRPYDSKNGPAAHPNSRFTVSAKQCASASPEMDNPTGVPLSAIVFGGRRKELAPLVMQARDWNHGVLMGASVASETTAAATGAVGVVRRDPMAMKPFCGYNFGDYWAHWLSFADRSDKLPQIFHVNWFRQDDDGKFLWPGFGDNLRVLRWVLDRCAGRGDAVETPVGWLPAKGALDTSGLNIDASVMDELLSIDPAAWRDEVTAVREYLESFGDRLPDDLLDELQRVEKRLQSEAA